VNQARGVSEGDEWRVWQSERDCERVQVRERCSDWGIKEIVEEGSLACKRGKKRIVG
jgi:hypothetical protein